MSSPPIGIRTSIFWLSRTFKHMAGDIMRAIARIAADRKSGRAVAAILAGLVREVWRKVPPVRSTVLHGVGIQRNEVAWRAVESSSGFTPASPPHPLRIPTT